jgi:cytochrome c oxidase cbb3-type subunit I/II
LYVVAIYSAGVTQGLMWRAFDETGRLAYPDFIETVLKLMPMFWMRVVGGTLYFVGVLIFGWNIVMTWARRPKTYAVPVIEAAPLHGAYVPAQDGSTAPTGVWGRFAAARWHRRWERAPLLFTVLTVLAVLVASLFEILPTFLIKSNVPTIASVKPYTPLELAGRDIYIAEGCFNCHSQMIRPFRYETERFGEYSKPGESVYDHPFLWGSRRIGPDLAREGGRYPDLWHVRHFENPRTVIAKSIMPSYSQFLRTDIDFEQIQRRVDVMVMLGVPYGEAVTRAPQLAREQAQRIGAAIAAQGGPKDLEGKQIVAIIAYMQRLGRDIKVNATALATGAH